VTDYSTDVVVVGGGPAGCILSYLLARSGVETTLVERQQTLDREFRGYGFRPPIPSLLAEMDLRDDIESLPHETISRGTLVAYGRSFPLFEFDDEQVILMKQPPLLRRVVTRAQEYDTFSFLNSTTVDGFLRDDGTISGVTATTRPSSERLNIQSQLVVGADGRYSTTREAAEIDLQTKETGSEVVWFRLPRAAADLTTHLRIERDGILAYSPLSNHESQYGLLIQEGTYQEIRDRDIESFRRQVAGIEPRLANSIDQHLTSFDQCALLSVQSALAERWVVDGLLLIGDAAHVASPIGAQGNNLAIQDAVIAHRILTPVLKRETASVSTDVLQRVERIRRPAIEEVIERQHSMGEGLTRLLTIHDHLPQSLHAPVLRGGAALVSLATRLSRRTETGAEPPSVDRDLFVG
jgi:2-polyprenyl-6-methoxyphenol hydroxylase-like FAD-dependent oxidoreductase